MKAVFVLFDTLVKDVLTAYNDQSWVMTPNFDRLKKHSIQFENFYAGSMPCMPARRELHTGRYNFLHRGWGPLEPFDDSLPEILAKNKIYTHLVSDHSHYFEDGGATYHNRFHSYENFRGQEGDRHLSTLDFNEVPPRPETAKKGYSVKQHYVNRKVQQKEEDYSSVKTIQAGIDFIKNHYQSDHWFLQIECFDPHEPFYAPERFRALYQQADMNFDWPAYKPLTETPEELNSIRNEYAALVSMCDEYLGKILDEFDKYKLWDNTMLIVGTDHGLLLGEHNWLGKNIAPMYNEVANIPFFLHIPNHSYGTQSKLLAQTIDIAPTLLDFFDVDIPKDMQGKSIINALNHNQNIREYALFGIFGGHVNITDGKHVYMRATTSLSHEILHHYTLMPTNMRGFFSNSSLQNAQLINLFEFTKELPVLKVQARPMISSLIYGHRLYDLIQDPKQTQTINDCQIEDKMILALHEAMRKSDAPYEQFIRLGLISEEKPNHFDYLDISKVEDKKILFLASFLTLDQQTKFADYIQTTKIIEECFEYVIEHANLKKRRQQLVYLFENIQAL